MDASLARGLAPARLLAPAKVNLALHVVGRRADGYHLLESLVTFAPAAGDVLRIETARGDGDDEVVVTGPFAASVPSGTTNIVRKALDLARRVASDEALTLAPVRVELAKNLPVASGIGGGSSDAAAILRWLARIAPPLKRRLFAESIALGADVPMCCEGVPAQVFGIGEIVEPVAAMPTLPLLLVNPRVEVSTAAVFARLESRDNGPLPPLASADLRSAGALAEWLRRTRNDLEAPALALAPSIEAVHDALNASGALFARMSGSGATVFGVFADEELLGEARRGLKAAYPAWWISGPDTGARDTDGPDIHDDESWNTP